MKKSVKPINLLGCELEVEDTLRCLSIRKIKYCEKCCRFNECKTLTALINSIDELDIEELEEYDDSDKHNKERDKLLKLLKRNIKYKN